MTSSKVVRLSDPLHRSVLGSNSLRGGKREYNAGVLVGNWFEERLDPEYQKWDYERKQVLRERGDHFYKPTVHVVGDTSDESAAIDEFNESGRADLGKLRRKKSRSPIPSFVPPDPDYGHLPPGKWDTMAELTHGLNPYWREKVWPCDHGNSILQYQHYHPDTHWRTSNMDHFRYKKPPKSEARFQTRADGGITRKTLPPSQAAFYGQEPMSHEKEEVPDEEDPFRPCFLRDNHLRSKYDKSTQTPAADLTAYRKISKRETSEEGQNGQVPLQPTWLTGATGRGQKPFYSSFCPPPSWPPPWREEAAAKQLEQASVKRPGAVQDLMQYAERHGKGRVSVTSSLAEQRPRAPSFGPVHQASQTDLTTAEPMLSAPRVQGEAALKHMAPPPVLGYTGHRRQRGHYPF